MRPEPNIRIEGYRKVHPQLGHSDPGANWGYFKLRGLSIISSGTLDNIDWEHVSVSLEDRCPTWEEMVEVKELFWSDDEIVLQFHPPKSKAVNTHPYCLHLWKPLNQTIELPHRDLVT